jgi:hypothetical protein
VVLLAVSVLWPSRLSGPLDGAPLDTLSDALIIGLALPVLLAIDRRIVRLTPVRALVVALLVWKAFLAVTAVPDGWCVRFTSPVPLFVDDVRVPHSWDVRADWRATTPRCSAVMTRSYRSIAEFPVWFYNLPPATWFQPAQETERPPHVTLAIDVTGSLNARANGTFRVDTGEGVTLLATVDGVAVPRETLAAGLALPAGSHDIALTGTMVGERWRLVPIWDGREMWSGSVATMAPPNVIDRWLRPWGRWVDPLLIVSLLAVALAHLIRRVGHRPANTVLFAGMALAFAASGRNAVMRLMPLTLAVAAALRLPRRLQNIFGAQVLIGVPFLALIAMRGLEEIGRTTWYTIGDDWWLFQRYAYRIYLQGFWLEGGEPAFWFQPFYRWIAGGLHMLFGDGSVGELFWDGACAWAGALFAFHVTRVVAGFRWGIVAAVSTLALFTIGPGWYLFGRGLSEMTSAGLTYAAVLLALRGRRSQKYVLAAGVCLALAFYTRLNNLPFVLAAAAFSLPLSQPAGDWAQWRSWWARCSRPALAGLIAAVLGAIVLFSLRTYYYTGSINALAGTQASARSVWQNSDAGETPAENLMGSVLMVLTMSDPPRFEPRAIPIVTGIIVAILALAGAGRLRRLPMNVSLLCLAGIVGAFVARGSAYPGRFSIHLIPVTVALTVSALSLWFGTPRPNGERRAAGGGR